VTFTCPVCGEPPKQYAPWYKASRGTLASHLYNVHAEELQQRLRNTNDSVIEKLRAAGVKVMPRSRAVPSDLPIKLILVKRGRR